DEAKWRANSQDCVTHQKSREYVWQHADWIVPGHGDVFRMSSHSLRCLTRLRLLKMAPSSSRSISATPLIGRRNGSPGDGSPFRSNQRGVPADRGGLSIDDLILPRGAVSLEVSLVVEEFMRRQMSAENGLTDKIFMKAFL
ncbi:hypothetical protein PFISCL1PPCAC_22513, partial [Pristionchus fissidentatus]